MRAKITYKKRGMRKTIKTKKTRRTRRTKRRTYKKRNGGMLRALTPKLEPYVNKKIKDYTKDILEEKMKRSETYKNTESAIEEGSQKLFKKLSTSSGKENYDKENYDKENKYRSPNILPQDTYSKGISVLKMPIDI